MRTQILALSLVSGLSLASFSAFAEPAVQAGETLESLSKVKVTTTVNGQPGSLNDLVSSGQVKLVNAEPNTTAPVANQAPSTDPAAAASDTINQPAAAPQADIPAEAPQQLSDDSQNIDPIN